MGRVPWQLLELISAPDPRTELPPRGRHQGRCAHLGPTHPGLPRDRAPIPGRNIAVSAHPPPIPGNFTIPAARGKRPRGLPKSRGVFVRLPPQTPYPGSAPALPLARFPNPDRIPAPSRALCPALAANKSSGESTARIPRLAHPRPAARDRDEPQERGKSPNPTRGARSRRHPQGEGWGCGSSDV